MGMIGCLRRFVPVPTAGVCEPPLTDPERRSFRRWEVWALLPFSTLAPLLSYGWYLALIGAASLVHQPTPETRFLVRPIPLFWGVPSMLLGIVTTSILLEGLYWAILRDQYRRFGRHRRERKGYDSYLALKFLSILVLFGSALCCYAVANTFGRFTDDGIEVGRFWSPRSTFYPYAQVRSIEHRATFQAPNGKTIERPHYNIRFDDGSTWSTRKGFRDPIPDRDARMMELVSRRSGRPIFERP